MAKTQRDKESEKRVRVNRLFRVVNSFAKKSSRTEGVRIPFNNCCQLRSYFIFK